MYEEYIYMSLCSMDVISLYKGNKILKRSERNTTKSSLTVEVPDMTTL